MCIILNMFVYYVCQMLLIHCHIIYYCTSKNITELLVQNLTYSETSYLIANNILF